MFTSPYPKKKGVALLLTLLVLTIMILTVGQISYSTKVEVQIANNVRDDLQNLKAAQSGIYFGIAFLRLDAQNKGEEAYHSLQDAWAEGVEPQKVGESTLNISLIDEERKFHILRLATGSEEDKKTAKEQFIRLVPLIFNDASYDAEGLADAIISWMSNETSEREERKLEMPLYSLRELQLIPNFMETFFSQEEENDYTFSTLTDSITIFSSGKININTAPPEQLQALHENIPEELIAAILNHRLNEEGYFRTLAEVEEALEIEEGSQEEEVYNEIKPFLTVKSEFFSASISASKGGLSRSYKAFYYQEDSETKVIHWELSQ